MLTKLIFLIIQLLLYTVHTLANFHSVKANMCLKRNDYSTATKVIEICILPLANFEKLRVDPYR
jgi:hypothetical protein